MTKDILLTPGPTPVPPEVLELLSEPIYHHRTPRARGVLEELTGRLQQIFRTENMVLTLTCSGTGAMEAAVVNAAGPNDKALTISGGKFGQRWGKICKAHGIPYEEMEIEWGAAIRPEAVKATLDADPSITMVCATFVETSTAVRHDIKALGELTKNTDKLLLVDGISGVGADPFETDAWGVDLLAVGSQKALMMPPGLAYLAVSEKAWTKIDANPKRGFYFDLATYRKSMAKFDTPYTPAHTLIRAQNKAAEMILECGLEGVWKANAKKAAAIRATLLALGIELFAESPSDAVTAFKVPEDVDGQALVSKMRDEHRVSIAGGQEHLKGKIGRIASMGFITDDDLRTGFKTMCKVLTELGHPADAGAAIETFNATFAK